MDSSIERKPIAKECKHVTHIPSTRDNHDAHIIKERIHYSDGTTEPHLQVILNYQRPFYITKPSERNYKDHKEWIKKDRVLEYQSTQSDLYRNIAKALDMYYSPNTQYNQLTSSPYLFGSDISSSALLKQAYAKKFPDVFSPYSVVYLDTETMAVSEEDPGAIFIMTLCYENKLNFYADVNWLPIGTNYDSLFKAAVDKYMAEDIEKYKLEIKLILCNNDLDILIKGFEWIHSLQPDIVAIWNMEFDIGRIQYSCDRHKYPIEDLISDPSIPKEYRRFKFKPGPTNKAKSKDGKQGAGKGKPLNPAERWHKVTNTSSFVFLDAMCTYRRIRIAKQEDAKTSLDYILNKELGLGKFKIETPGNLTDLAWHKYAREHKPWEYLVYGGYDTFRMKLLNDKTGDLSLTLPINNQSTEFNNSNSQIKKISDFLHGYCLDNGYVIGVGAPIIPDYSPRSTNDLDTDDDDDEEDEDTIEVLSLKSWIAIFESHLMRRTGLALVEGTDKILTFIRLLLADLDCISSYPSDSIALNISKTTCKSEINSVLDTDEKLYRLANIDLLGGHVNALKYLQNMFNYPNFDKILDSYLNYKLKNTKPTITMFDI